MRLGLTYDVQTDPTDWRQAEFDPPRVIEQVYQALADIGHDVVRLGNAQELLANRARLAGVELVFNLAEGAHGRCREAWVPTLLELLSVPYVGSDALALCLGLDKVASKQLAAASDFSTPAWIMIDRPATLPTRLPFTWPAIVKPRYEGSGMGIDEGAVVSDAAALRRRVAWAWERFQQPLLVEQFIPHGELTVCLIGNNPPVAYPPIQRPIDPHSRLSCHVAPGAGGSWIAPLHLNEPLESQARHIALTMFAELGCADMARVDLRVDERGRVWFLEINPLPSFDPAGSLGLLAEHLNLSYARLLERILDAACTRLHLSMEIRHDHSKRSA